MGQPAALNLTLWRLALVTFTPSPRQANSFDARFEGAEVRTLRSQTKDDSLTTLMAAGIRLVHRPKLAAGRLVVVRDDARRAAEEALERLVNAIAVAESCERSIASPFPWVAFEPHDADARRWLQDAGGIHALDHIASVPNLTGAPIPVEDAGVMDGLSDRWDGVALLAEAFAHRHPTGRLHELFRVFERAFALSARKLAPVLVDFLHPRYGYAADEIGAWIELRDPATHADARPTFVLEAEVRPILRRMEPGGSRRPHQQGALARSRRGPSGGLAPDRVDQESPGRRCRPPAYDRANGGRSSSTSSARTRQI